MKKIFLFVIALVLIDCVVAQPENTTMSLKQKKEYGNKLLKQALFGKALPVWSEIRQADPTNADVNFKLGLCYHYSFDKKPKALPFFKIAAQNIIEKHHFYNENETEAPFEALFFLGESYLANNKPDSALQSFIAYQDKYENEPPLSITNRVKICVNVNNMLKNPRTFKMENLGILINSDYSESNPVISLRQDLIAFASHRLPQNQNNIKNINPVTGVYDTDVYIITQDNLGNWQKPVYFEYNTQNNETPLCLSPDGKTLYFSREEKSATSVFTSIWNDEGYWTTPQKMKLKISSRKGEIWLSISSDQKYLYFASDKKGGYGGYDIYYCTKKDNETWRKPKNIGREINTPMDEIAPNINASGQVLFFSTNGRSESGMGGTDIYYTEKKGDNTWSKPCNIGYPVNTTLDDNWYFIAANGKAYLSQLTAGSSYDIIQVSGIKASEIENIDTAGVKIVEVEVDVMDVLTLEEEVIKTEIIQEDIGHIGKDQVDEVSKIIAYEEVYVTQEVGNNGAAEELVVAEEVPDNRNIEQMPTIPDSTNTHLQATNNQASTENIPPQSVDGYPVNFNWEPYQQATGLGQADIQTIFKAVFFEFNSAELSEPSKIQLQKLADYLKQNTKIKLELVGHADNTGNWEINVNLSNRRAKTVYEYLLQCGLENDRFIFYGKSYAAPFTDNATTESRKYNRRVELLLLQ